MKTHCRGGHEGTTARRRTNRGAARPSSFILHPSSLRSGVTLIELLVVITIILMMMGLAAQRMQSAKGARRSREAARALAVYLGSARSRAIASRRSCGVALVAAPGISSCVMTPQLVEMPPPYAGDSIGATATVQAGSGTYQANLTGVSNLSNCVHKGDKIQFNYEGPWYIVSADPSQGGQSLTFSLDPNDPLSASQQVPWSPSGPSSPMAFCIKRQPIVVSSINGLQAHKSLAAPLQLPAGSVIDLTGSGGAGRRRSVRPQHDSDLRRLRPLRGGRQRLLQRRLVQGQPADLPAGGHAGQGPLWGAAHGGSDSIQLAGRPKQVGGHQSAERPGDDRAGGQHDQLGAQ